MERVKFGLQERQLGKKMYVNELNDNTKVEIKIRIGKEELRFVTQTVQIPQEDSKEFEKVKKKFKVAVKALAPIKKEDKMIGFPDIRPGVSYEINTSKDEKAYVWNIVAIRSVRFSSGKCYHILCSNQSVDSLNRRENFRLWLGASGIAQFGLNNKTYTVTVKDLSAGGVGILVDDTEFEPRIGMPVILSFEDSDTDSHFKIRADVVRIVRDEGNLLLGCTLKLSGKEAREGRSEAILSFINKKQSLRQRLNKKK